MNKPHYLASIADADREGFSGFAQALRWLYLAEFGHAAPSPDALVVKTYLHSAQPWEAQPDGLNDGQL